METVSSVLSFIFRWLFFPAVYVSVFAALVFFVSIVVSGPPASQANLARQNSAFIRRLVAALLPFVVLVFTISFDKEALSGLDLVLGYPWVAVLVGVVLVEFGRFIRKTDAEIIWVLYAFVLSCLGCTLLFLTMFRLATPVHWLMLSFIVGAGACIILRGLPE